MAAASSVETLDPPVAPVATLHLVDKEGNKHQLTHTAAQLSQVVVTAISSVPEADKKDDIIVPTILEPAVLAVVVEYLKMHNGVVTKTPHMPLRDADLVKAGATEEDAAFAHSLFARDPQLFYRVFEAANYLDIASLMSLSLIHI